MKWLTILIIAVVATSGCLASSEKKAYCQAIENNFTDQGFTCQCEAATKVVDNLRDESKSLVDPTCNCDCLDAEGNTVRIQLATPRQS